MKTRSLPDGACFLVLAALAFFPSATPCLASPKYSLTDLGVASSGRPIFDSQGLVNSTPIYSTALTRSSDGLFSISSVILGPNRNTQRALANIEGGTAVPIPPVVVGPNTLAYSVNSSGTFVGLSSMGDRVYGHGTAFSFTIDGGSKAVLVPYLDSDATALGINEAGQIVGTVFHGASSAFLTDGQSSWDLNTLVGPGGEFLLTSASDINDLGQIVGRSFDMRDDTDHFFLLTPTATPEPSSILMFALGVSAYGLRRWAGRKAG